jgi:hypothetical protein
MCNFILCHILSLEISPILTAGLHARHTMCLFRFLDDGVTCIKNDRYNHKSTHFCVMV